MVFHALRIAPRPAAEVGSSGRQPANKRQLKPSSRHPFQAPACCARALPPGAHLAQERLRAAHPPAHLKAAAAHLRG